MAKSKTEADDMIEKETREEFQEDAGQFHDAPRSSSRDGESDEESSSSDGEFQSHHSNDDHRRRRPPRRTKGGSRHKKRVAPYTTEPENESLRAHLRRASLLASGHPLAPYNTTQYLMTDAGDNEASPEFPTFPQSPAHSSVAPSATPRHPGIGDDVISEQNNGNATPNQWAQLDKIFNPASATPSHPGITTPPFVGYDGLYSGQNSGNATPSQGETPNHYDEEFVENYERVMMNDLMNLSKAQLLDLAVRLLRRCERLNRNVHRREHSGKSITDFLAEASRISRELNARLSEEPPSSATADGTAANDDTANESADLEPDSIDFTEGSSGDIVDLDSRQSPATRA